MSKVIKRINPGDKLSPGTIEKVFSFFLFVLFIGSLKPWFLWNVPQAYISLCCVATGLCYMAFYPENFFFKKSLLIVVAVFLAAKIYCVGNHDLKTYIVSFITAMPIIICLFYRKENQYRVLAFITDALGVLLAVSLVFWFFYKVLGISMFDLGRISHPAGKNYVYTNYLFFIDNIKNGPRFNSVFLEPGHIGSIIPIMLLVNRFNFKKASVVVLAVTLFATLSLAAYLLFFVSGTLYLILFNIVNRKILLYGATAFGLVFFAVRYYNGGHNVLNNKIVHRLEYNEKTANIKGYNRYSPRMDIMYPNYIKSKYVWAGIGMERYTKLNLGNNAGYRVFIVQFGILGTFLVAALYLLLVYFNFSKFSVLLYLTYVLVFLQRTYPFWESQLLAFILSVHIYSLKNKNE